MADTPKLRIANNELNILMNTILQQYPNCIVLKKTPYILVLSNKNLSSEQGVMYFFKNLASSNPIQIGFALPCQGLLKTSSLFEQAQAALQYGALYQPESVFHYFYDYAIDFIIESKLLKKSVLACHPATSTLWHRKKEFGDEMFDTLKTYLDNECSIGKTASAMFIHRNTIIYRIKKIQNYIKDNLKSVYSRDYIRLSTRILELYDKKYGSGL